MLPLPIVAAALALAVSPTGRGGALTVLGGAIESAGVGEAPLGWRQMGGAWVRIPQRALPWGAVHFLGGAALGAAPQLVYDRLLSEICERAQVAVIAVPYSPEQDHDKLARQVRASPRPPLAAGLPADGTPEPSLQPCSTLVSPERVAWLDAAPHTGRQSQRRQAHPSIVLPGCFCTHLPLTRPAAPLTRASPPLRPGEPDVSCRHRRL